MRGRRGRGRVISLLAQMGDLLADGGRVRDDHRLGDLLLVMLVVGLGVEARPTVDGTVDRAPPARPLSENVHLLARRRRDAARRLHEKDNDFVALVDDGVVVLAFGALNPPASCRVVKGAAHTAELEPLHTIAHQTRAFHRRLALQ